MQEPMVEGFDKCILHPIKVARGLTLLPTPLVSRLPHSVLHLIVHYVLMYLMT